MSRLTELLGELRKQNAQLSADIEAEITAIAKQRSFGVVLSRAATLADCDLVLVNLSVR